MKALKISVYRQIANIIYRISRNKAHIENSVSASSVTSNKIRAYCNKNI